MNTMNAIEEKRGLFGQLVIDPLTGDQFRLFHEPVNVPVPAIAGETAADRRIARLNARTPTAPMFNAPAPKLRPPTLPERVEKQLRERGIACVSVDEAKRSLFGKAKLQAFHFVVYAADGSHWLLLCSRPTPKNRESMRQWQDVFGDGYKAVFAVDQHRGRRFSEALGRCYSDSESLRYLSMTGETIELPK